MATFPSAGAPRFKFTYPKSRRVTEIKGIMAGQAGVDVSLLAQDEKRQQVTTLGYIHAREVAGKVSETTPSAKALFLLT